MSFSVLSFVLARRGDRLVDPLGPKWWAFTCCQKFSDWFISRVVESTFGLVPIFWSRAFPVKLVPCQVIAQLAFSKLLSKFPWNSNWTGN